MFELLFLSTPRSGSTMLAGLYTVPGKHIVFDEPNRLPPPNPYRGVSYNSQQPWGVKACLPVQVPKRYPPLVYTLVRNPKDIVRSMVEKNLRFGRSEAETLSGPLANGRIMLTHMRDTNIIRYEDLVNGVYPDIPGWEPLGATDFWTSRAIRAKDRAYETERHGTTPNATKFKRAHHDRVERFSSLPEVRDFVRQYEKRYDYA